MIEIVPEFAPSLPKESLVKIFKEFFEESSLTVKLSLEAVGVSFTFKVNVTSLEQEEFAPVIITV